MSAETKMTLGDVGVPQGHDSTPSEAMESRLSYRVLPDGWVTTGDAQIMTGYSAKHLQWLARTGQVEAAQSRPGCAWRYRAESLREYMGWIA